MNEHSFDAEVDDVGDRWEPLSQEEQRTQRKLAPAERVKQLGELNHFLVCCIQIVDELECNDSSQGGASIWLRSELRAIRSRVEQLRREAL